MAFISEEGLIFWGALDTSQYDICNLADTIFFGMQASELEVLQAVLKWGEQELVRRMEDRGTSSF